MREFARSTVIRIFAVLVILALRPCMVVAAVSLDNARTNHPAIQYIADDEAIAHMAHGRPVWLTAPAAMAALSGTIVVALLVKPPQSFAAVVDIAPPALDGATVEVFGSRAPPL
jgi:hypothetical protein